MAAHSDIRRMVSDFVAEAKSLCERMLLSDRMRLNAMDVHVLRAQLKVLDAKAAKLEELLTAWSADGRTKIEAEPPSRSTLPNEPPFQQEGRADLFKRAE